MESQAPIPPAPSLGGRGADFEQTYRLPTGNQDLQVHLDLHRSFGPHQQYPVDYESVAPACCRSEHGPYLILEPGHWTCALAIHQVRNDSWPGP